MKAKMKAQRQGDFQPERVPSDESDKTMSADLGSMNPVDASLLILLKSVN